MITLKRIRIGESDYININDFQKVIVKAMTSIGSGYLSTQYLLNSLFNILEDAKVPTKCQDCGKDSYIIYPVPIKKETELKFICDVCFDAKYRKSEEKSDDIPEKDRLLL